MSSCADTSSSVNKPFLRGRSYRGLSWYSRRRRDDTAIEALPASRQCPALIQDFHDLLIGVMIGQSINLGDSLCRRCSEFPGGQGSRQLQRLRRSAAEADMNSDPISSNERHVSEQ